MDLRVKRTKAALRNAYVELRKQKPLEKLTVTEITKLAKVNKATYYTHYSDIYALFDEIEYAVIDEILADVQIADKFFDNPREYSIKIFNAIVQHRHELDIVFANSRRSLFADKLEERIKAMVFANHDNMRTTKNELILTFIIQGIFHTVKTERSGSLTIEAYDEISQITMDIVSRLQSDT